MAKPRTRRGRQSRKAGEHHAGARILDTAGALFYRHGIHAVGVETIVRQAGVAKISLYRAFPSKDELIAAYLGQRNRDYWQALDAVLARHAGQPRAQLRALFAYLTERTTSAGYRGCPFIHYAAEFPERSHPGRAVMAANKRETQRRLVALAEAIGTPQPRQLADALFLVMEGAYASSQTLGGGDGPAKAALWAAEALIDSQRTH